MAHPLNPRRKYFLFLTATFAVLLAIELLLRVLGAVLLLPSVLRNRVGGADRGALRILVLGESTSAEYFCEGKDCSWPSQLEGFLLSHGVPAKVFNEAVGGTTSSLLLLRLPGFLERYHPDLVISMMGINDVIPISLVRPSLVWRTIDDLRLVKVGHWIATALSRLRLCKLVDSHLDPKYNEVVERGLRLAKSAGEPVVEATLKKEISNSRDLALVLYEIGWRLRGDLTDADRENLLRVADYDDRAFELFPWNRSIAFQSIQVESNFPGRPQCVEFSKKILTCGENVDDGTLTQILYCLANHRDRELQERATRLGITLTSDPSNLTTENYRAIASMLNDRKIAYIAMQYPTLPLAALEARFEDAKGNIEAPFRGISFVSNEANFAEALKTNSYDELFRDRFRGSWGHATLKGNRLIAKSAYEAVMARRGENP